MVTVKTMARIDAPNAPVLEEMLKNAYESDNNITIDMSETMYVCSIGLRVILALQKRVSSGGGSLVIKNVQSQILEIFEVTGFIGFLNIE